MPIQGQTPAFSNIQKIHKLLQGSLGSVNPVYVELNYGGDRPVRDVKITEIAANNYKVEWPPKKENGPTRSFTIDSSGNVTSVGGKDASSQKMIAAINSYAQTIENQNFENLDILFKDLDSGSKIRVPYPVQATRQTHYEITLSRNPDQSVAYHFKEIPNGRDDARQFTILKDATGNYKIENVGSDLRAAHVPSRLARTWYQIVRRAAVAPLVVAPNPTNSIQLPFLQNLMQNVQASSLSVARDQQINQVDDRIKQLFKTASSALLGKGDNQEFFVVGNVRPAALNDISITKIASDREQNATKIKFRYHDGNGVVEFDVEMKGDKYLVSGVVAAHDPAFVANPVTAIRNLMARSGSPLNLVEKITAKSQSDFKIKAEQRQIFDKISKFLYKYPNANLDLGDNHSVQKISPTQFRIVLSNAADDNIIVTKNRDGSYKYDPHNAKLEYRSNPSLFQAQLSAIEKKFNEMEDHRDTPHDQLDHIGVSGALQAVILQEKKVGLAKKFLEIAGEIGENEYKDYQEGRAKKRVYVERDGDHVAFRAIVLTDDILTREQNLKTLQDLLQRDTQLRDSIRARFIGRDKPANELAQRVVAARDNTEIEAAIEAILQEHKRIWEESKKLEQTLEKHFAREGLIIVEIRRLEEEISRPISGDVKDAATIESEPQAELEALRQELSELQSQKQRDYEAIRGIKENIAILKELYEVSDELKQVNQRAARIVADGAIDEKIAVCEQQYDQAINARKQDASAQNFKVNTNDLTINYRNGQAYALANIDEAINTQALIDRYSRIADNIAPARSTYLGGETAFFAEPHAAFSRGAEHRESRFELPPLRGDFPSRAAVPAEPRAPATSYGYGAPAHPSRAAVPAEPRAPATSYGSSRASAPPSRASAYPSREDVPAHPSRASAYPSREDVPAHPRRAAPSYETRSSYSGGVPVDPRRDAHSYGSSRASAYPSREDVPAHPSRAAPQRGYAPPSRYEERRPSSSIHPLWFRSSSTEREGAEKVAPRK